MASSTHTIEQTALSLVIREGTAFDEAQSLATGGRPAEALQAYAGIAAARAELHYQEALRLAQRNDAGGAAALLRWCVAANPRHFHGWLRLAQLHSGAEAERYCRRALDVMPGNIDAVVRLAGLLIAGNRRLQAADVLAQAGSAISENFETQFALAELWWQLGNFPAAEAALRRLIAMNQTDVRPYQTLLELLNRQDRLEDAEALCRVYLELRSADQQVRIELAACLARQQRWDDAEAVCFGLLAEVQDPMPVYQLYAGILEKCGRLDEAQEILQKMVERAPGSAIVYLKLADFEHRTGNTDAARQRCRQVARMYAESAGRESHVLPQSLQQRLVFHEMESIVGKYCTGERAVLDYTGLSLAQSAFEFGEVVEFFCMVAGREHVDFLEHIAYPAMSSAEGFDDLLRERKAVYNIYTTPADFESLRGFLARLDQRGIRYRVNVELLSFSQDPYPILTLPVIDQVKRALALRSVVFTTLPDLIMSGSIYRVLKDMRPYETVACAMPRIDSEIAYPELKKQLATGRVLDSREFVRRSMTDFMHPQTYSALVSESNCLRYRDMGGYYSARNWVPPPLGFYAREEMLDHMMRKPLCGPNSIGSFYAIDHDFIDSAWRTGKLRLIEDSDYFFWAELTHPARHADFLAGRKSEDYYAPESSRRIFQHEFKWIYADRD